MTGHGNVSLGQNFTSTMPMVVLQPSTSILVPIVMFSIGATGNIIALGMYHCSSSWHRGTAFYGLLRGFFLTSIVGYLTVYPVIISVHVRGLRWIGGSRMCDFHGFVVLTFGMSLAYITGVLGFERFLAACRPYTYNRKVEPRKIPFVLVLLWLVSIFTGILPLVGFGRISLQYPATWCFIDWRNEETVGRLFSSVLATIVVSVILLVVVSIFAATIGASYRTSKKCHGTIAGKDADSGSYSLAMTTDDNPHRIPRRYFAADRALMWATIHYDILASGFLVCYIPVVMRIISNVSGQQINNFKNMAAMHWAEFYPAFCPWLYILLHEQIWMRLTCREPPYRDVPYTRASSRRRSSGNRASPADNDYVREAESGGRREPVDVSSTSNHINVVMHDHVDGYVVGGLQEDDDEVESALIRSARKRLEFIKEDDSREENSSDSSPPAIETPPGSDSPKKITTIHRSLDDDTSTSSSTTSTPEHLTIPSTNPSHHQPPGLPTADGPDLSCPSSSQEHQTPLPSSPSSETPEGCLTANRVTPQQRPMTSADGKPIIISPNSPNKTKRSSVVVSAPKAKLTVTTSHPTANGPVIQNHVNAVRSMSGGTPRAGYKATRGAYVRVDDVAFESPTNKPSTFAQAGRKESMI
ncbi:uncharacterized protein [Diadema antillarum]|uniref:uncharacterized protein n=1 Tax=Diadema antillarum TaxID=105358 RepID=UPI003A86BD97